VLANPQRAVLERIYVTKMNMHLEQVGAADEPLAPVFRDAVRASVAMLEFSQEMLKPTPSKSHYLFSMREIDRVVQGLCRIKMDALKNDSRKAIRYWVHEAMRAFSDRVSDAGDMQLVVDRIAEAVRVQFRENLQRCLEPVLGAEPVGFADMAERLMFTDQVAGRAAVDEVQPGNWDDIRANLERCI
jgi:dynein heavy chain, axonemal